MALVISQFSVESKFLAAAARSGKVVICDQATHRVFDSLNGELVARQYGGWLGKYHSLVHRLSCSLNLYGDNST